MDATKLAYAPIKSFAKPMAPMDIRHRERSLDAVIDNNPSTKSAPVSSFLLAEQRCRYRRSVLSRPPPEVPVLPPEA